jgi:hypothetical protein
LLKKCPICNTSNDDRAEACSYCGYIFEDIKQSSSGYVSQSDFGGDPRGRFEVTSPHDTTGALRSTSEERDGTTSFGINEAPQTGEPEYTISTRLGERRSIASIVFSFVLGSFFVLINFFGEGISYFAILISLVFFVPAIVSIIRGLLYWKKFDFYPNSLVILGRAGKIWEIPYSEILDVRKLRTGRSGAIHLVLKSNRRGILIPGDPLGKRNNEDLFTYLKQRTTGSTSAEGTRSSGIANSSDSFTKPN